MFLSGIDIFFIIHVIKDMTFYKRHSSGSVRARYKYITANFNVISFAN